MKIFVTGASGMLGSDVCPALKNEGHEVFVSDINGVSGKPVECLDICDFSKVESCISEIKPDMVIHLAAKTDVDRCEIEEKQTFMVNALATENIARVCGKRSIALTYTSTAAVFDGENGKPYVETDMPNPRSVYAKSKFEGEEFIRKLVKKHFIARAGWMMGGINRDKKFVAKILKILETKNELYVVNDKFGSPTFTKDFAYVLAQLITTTNYDTYHMANKGNCSRYDITKKIVEFLGRDDVKIHPVSSKAFPNPMARGRSERLENKKLDQLNMNYMRPWQEALEEYVLEWKKRKEA